MIQTHFVIKNAARTAFLMSNSSLMRMLRTLYRSQDVKLFRFYFENIINTGTSPKLLKLHIIKGNVGSLITCALSSPLP